MKISRILSMLVIIFAFIMCSISISAAPKEKKMTEKEFNSAIKFLREHVLLLQVHYAPPTGGDLVKQTISSYGDMMKFIKKKVPGKFYLMNEKSKELTPICEIGADEMANKSAGQWFWKQVCNAAEGAGIMKDCNKFFNWK